VILIAFAVIATLGYYQWTGTVFFESSETFEKRLDDHFNLLAHGFRKGHLYLDKQVPQQLLEAKNPYDPKQREGISFPHDSSYYKGHYYIYFGPGPVLTLFLPFSVITGYDLPVSLAVRIFCWGGYLVLLALFLWLQRRYYPRASLSALFSCLLVLGGGTMTIALLRRPNIWEVSSSAGFFYFSLTLLCLVRALHSRRPALWTLAGGLALGLAVASRPTYLLCSPIFALPLLLRSRPPEPGATRYTWRALAGAALPCTLIVLGLLGYNQARFGEPFEFGQRYQLSGIIEGDARHFSFSYLPYNLYIYGYSALRWFGAFPFVRPIVTPPEPDGYGDQEFSFGMLTTLPFVIFGVVAMAGLIWRRLRGPSDDGRWPVFAALLGAFTLTFGPLSVFFGSCVRYMADFTPSIMLLACFGFLELESRFAGIAAKRLFRTTGVASATVSVVVPGLAMVDAYDILPGTPPPRYTPIGHALNAPIRWLDRIRHPDYRPWELSLTFPEDRSRRREPLIVVHKWSEPSAVFFVEYLERDVVRFGYHESPGSPDTVYSPTMLATAGTLHSLRVTLGDPNAPLHNGTKSWLRLHYDGRFIWETASVSPAGFPGTVVVGEAPAKARAGARFTGKIHSSAAASDTNAAGISRPLLGARARIRLTSSMRDHSYPLAVTGVAGTGDIFFLRLSSKDELSFGYDHWGQPSQMSTPQLVALDRDCIVDFWLPALAPDKKAAQNLLVKVDGVVVWQPKVDHYPFKPNQVYFGYNPIGGTSTERTLDTGIYLSTELPFPTPTASGPALGARMRVPLSPSMRGHSYPLAVTGAAGAGDIFFLRLSAQDELSFGYDHWGRPCELSAPRPVQLDRGCIVEFWLPALAPDQKAPPALLVKVDGAVVWQTKVEHYPFQPDQVYFGYNPIGGTAAERSFDSGIVESTDLPFSAQN
jgi:hypothetical protein